MIEKERDNRWQCTVGVQMELKHEEATFSYIASLLRYYGAETYSVIKCLIINKDFCPGRLLYQYLA